MCVVFFIGKIDTVYENINQITVVFQTINVALNKVVGKRKLLRPLSVSDGGLFLLQYFVPTASFAARRGEARIAPTLIFCKTQLS